MTVAPITVVVVRVVDGITVTTVLVGRCRKLEQNGVALFSCKTWTTRATALQVLA